MAYTISAIAHWDWPEEWPELFDILVAALKPGHPQSEFSVQGAVRVLKEFSRDLPDSQIENVSSESRKAEFEFDIKVIRILLGLPRYFTRHVPNFHGTRVVFSEDPVTRH